MITGEEYYKAPGLPYFYVKVNVLKFETRGYIYSISISFNQMTILIRNYMKFFGATWPNRGILGVTRESSSSDAFQKIRGDLKDLIDIFINDYLSVNPK